MARMGFATEGKGLPLIVSLYLYMPDDTLFYRNAGSLCLCNITVVWVTCNHLIVVRIRAEAPLVLIINLTRYPSLADLEASGSVRTEI